MLNALKKFREDNFSIPKDQTKKPLTAFQLFQKQEFRFLKEKKVKEDVKVLGSKIAEKWKNLDNKEKNKYIAENKKLKKEYKSLKENYEMQLDPKLLFILNEERRLEKILDEENIKVSTKPLKHPLEPERPTNPVTQFGKDLVNDSVVVDGVRINFDDLNLQRDEGETKIMYKNRLWKLNPKNIQNAYKSKYLHDLNIYKQELEKYEKQHDLDSLKVQIKKLFKDTENYTDIEGYNVQRIYKTTEKMSQDRYERIKKLQQDLLIVEDEMLENRKNIIS
ncbi:hypothetical protein HDU92_005119 [Lobulomyces angularis]|nr:hypothetical protein HDU92_005119 [Lobulomyces angularis]